jgi:hypothetical protein
VFRRLVVIADPLTPRCGAFALSLDWGRRFHAPLFGFGGRATEAEPLCAELCAQCHVPWASSSWQRQLRTELAPIMTQDDLLVVDQALPQPDKGELFREMAGQSIPVMFCSARAHLPVTRILLLDQGNDGDGNFLNEAAGICRSLGATLVVLSVAKSERIAKRLQQGARHTLAGYGLAVDFDLFVGPDVCAAAASVARWRQCSLVIMEHPPAVPWWWRRNSSTTQLTDRTDSPTFLISLGGIACAARQPIMDSASGLQDNGSRGCFGERPKAAERSASTR